MSASGFACTPEHLWEQGLPAMNDNAVSQRLRGDSIAGKPCSHRSVMSGLWVAGPSLAFTPKSPPGWPSCSMRPVSGRVCQG
ncbi:hypothetical protein DKY63_25155 [Pseudomonas putida]|uniref:Uncharacterized protein n=1 Tax=Pseudomonas putida TaxID=303 RepID=A0A2Z4RPE0_PSEPU|nr:hypothetical protein DKY63_25155 [Pseudomonas putida]